MKLIIDRITLERVLKERLAGSEKSILPNNAYIFESDIVSLNPILERRLGGAYSDEPYETFEGYEIVL